MRFWLVAIFILLFSLQSVASAVESEAVSSHDQTHHQTETGHDEANHGEAEHEGKHHAHLCHHHHGEHTAKVMFQAPKTIHQFVDSADLLGYSANYQDIPSNPLYRPPIA